MLGARDAPGRGATERERKIRLLFLGANPTGTTRLALDREVREITQRLRATPHYERFELIQEWAVQVDDLQSALLRYTPDIVHFSGHGLGPPSTAPASGNTRDVHWDNVSEGARPTAAASSEILVEDVHGNPVGISATDLTELLRLVGGVRCVVLNACSSASQSAAICKQADCVVGIASAIPDSTAIAFAWAFYQALGFGESVETAFALGRNQLALAKLPGAELPELMLRDGVTADEIRLREPVRRSPWRGVLGIGALLAVLGTLVGLRVAAGRSTVPIGTERDVPPIPPPGMVWIPPADTVLGTTDTELRELRMRCATIAGDAVCAHYDEIGFWDREPRRRVHVAGFFLDRTEVTTRQLATWLVAAGATIRGEDIELDGLVVARAGLVIEIEATGPRAKPGLADLPVIDVTWDGARLFCGSRDATLPTGVQWERAARGSDGATWPWGDRPPACADAVLARGAGGCSGESRMQLANNARRDRTSEGVLDMIGNVSEWVLDVGPRPELHEVRGGSYASAWIAARPAARIFFEGTAPDLGFRCAKGAL